MFCPIGPSVNGNASFTLSVSLSGIDLNRAVVRIVNPIQGGNATVSFTGVSGTFLILPGITEIFVIPDGATDVEITNSSNASITVGRDI